MLLIKSFIVKIGVKNLGLCKLNACLCVIKLWVTLDGATTKQEQIHFEIKLKSNRTHTYLLTNTNLYILIFTPQHA